MSSIQASLASIGVSNPVVANSVTTKANGKDKGNAELAAIMARLQALEAENQALKASKQTGARPPITFKISEKGALSMYGLGRFPVTLYASQWEVIVSHASKIGEILKTNASALTHK